MKIFRALDLDKTRYQSPLARCSIGIERQFTVETERYEFKSRSKQRIFRYSLQFQIIMDVVF